MIRAAVLLLALLGATSVASATDPGSRPAVPPTTSFVTLVAAANLFEIESSKLALRRSTSEPVRGVATRMVADHTVATATFKQAIADARLVTPLARLDARQQAILEDLKTRDATSFDEAYMAAQYKAHVETIDLFKAYAVGGDDARMKQFASELLPVLHAHLEHVTKMH
jgi:putative membrane protein